VKPAPSAPCANCSFPVEVSRAEIEGVLRGLSEQRGRPFADPDTAAARLNHCFRCDALGPGSTCRYCGALVEVKARLSDEHCPYPGKPKW